MIKTEEPKRDNVLYLEFPSTWVNQDIFDLFSPYGAVHIGWINDTSAFVAIQNQDNVKKAAGQLVGVTGRDFKCYFYSTYVKQLSKPKIPHLVTPPANTASEKPQKNGGNLTPTSGDKRKRNQDGSEAKAEDSVDVKMDEDKPQSAKIDEDEINGTKKIKKM
jgi:hypothetical protein